jgi:hypothetical protein
MPPVRLVRSFCTCVSSCVNLVSLNWGLHTEIYEESRAVICVTENLSNRKGARHIESREHFVDHLVKERIVKLVQCKPNRMVADALTMNLLTPPFEQYRSTMMGEDELPFSAMRGAVLSDDVPSVGT